MFALRQAKTEYDYRRILAVESRLCELRPAAWHFHFGGIGFERYFFGDGGGDFFAYGYLLLDGDSPIGYALCYRDEGEFRLALLPGRERRISESLALLERVFPSGRRIVTDGNETDPAFCAALAGSGYRRGEETRFQAALDLREYAPEPVEWRDEQLEPLTDADIADRVRYASLPTGAEITRDMLDEYRRSADAEHVRDLVVRSADSGEFAAYLSWWMDENSGTVMLNPVACVEKFRGREIALRAIRSGLAEMKKRGFAFAYVDTGLQNLPARRLYEKAGFVQTGRTFRFSKELDVNIQCNKRKQTDE